MPQFNVAYFIPQMAWLAVMFSLLYFVIVRATLPRLGKVMDEREGKVMGDLQSAEVAKADADRIAAAYHADLAKAHEEARGLIAVARSNAQRAVEANLASTDAVIHEKLHAAQQALDAATAKGKQDIAAIAADSASDIVERLTGKRPDAANATAAADAAMAQR